MDEELKHLYWFVIHCGDSKRLCLGDASSTKVSHSFRKALRDLFIHVAWCLSCQSLVLMQRQVLAILMTPRE